MVPGKAGELFWEQIRLASTCPPGVVYEMVSWIQKTTFRFFKYTHKCVYLLKMLGTKKFFKLVSFPEYMGVFITSNVLRLKTWSIVKQAFLKSFTVWL